MFERIISIDWSGAGSENDGVDLRVALWENGSEPVLVDRRVGQRVFISWTRTECRSWLAARLAENRRTLVAMDFGFGLPWGADRKVFKVQGWRAMICQIAKCYGQHVTARAMAQAINEEERFDGHGPYRFNDTRSDYRFYVDNGVAYYRLTELAAPQAISQWYLGSGGVVGFHSITGMAAIAQLIDLREKSELDFQVWPQEGEQLDGGKHVLVESYPAICPRRYDDGQCRDDHQRDAWKVLQYLVTANQNGHIGDWFTIAEQPFGRIENVEFHDQIGFEGWIFGLR